MSSSRLLKFRQTDSFAAMMPACRRGLGEMDLTDSETMLRLFRSVPMIWTGVPVLSSGWTCVAAPPVLFDPFDPGALNGHMVVLARSGAGKSFVTKVIVEREALRDIPVYIIDPEGEYGVITEALGGEVFVPGSPGYGLNPFVIGFADAGDLAKRVSSLCSLVGVMLEGQVNQMLKASIDRCMTAFYKAELMRVGNTGLLGQGGIESFHNFLSTDAAKDMGGPELAHLLSPFATGSAVT